MVLFFFFSFFHLMLLAHSKEVKICSEYIKIQLHEKMHLTSVFFLLLFFFYFTYNLEDVFSLLTCASKRLASSVSYLKSHISINDFLEKKNIVF